MDFIADTSILISFFRGHESSVNLLMRKLVEHRLCLPSIVVFELTVGVHPGSKQARSINELLSVTPVIPLDGPAAEQAAAVYKGLRSEGQDIGVPDALIAGIALQRGMPLLTENVSHFSRVPELIIWSAAG